MSTFKKKLAKPVAFVFVFNDFKGRRGPHGVIWAPGGDFLRRPETTSIFGPMFEAKSYQNELHLGSLWPPKGGRKSSPKIDRKIDHKLSLGWRYPRSPWELKIHEVIEDIRI